MNAIVYHGNQAARDLLYQHEFHYKARARRMPAVSASDRDG